VLGLETEDGPRVLIIAVYRKIKNHLIEQQSTHAVNGWFFPTFKKKTEHSQYSGEATLNEYDSTSMFMILSVLLRSTCLSHCCAKNGSQC
jgi:hypothetical protein